MKLINDKNIRIQQNDKISYANNVIVTFELGKNVSNFDLEVFNNFFSTFVHFGIIEDMFEYENKMKQNLDISALDVNDTIFSSRRIKKLRLTFDFLDFNIDNNFSKIEQIIKAIFDYKAGKKLVNDIIYSIENQRIQIRNMSKSDLTQLQTKWKVVNQSEHKENIISEKFYNLLVDENVQTSHLFKLFVDAYRNIFSNISSSSVIITGQAKKVSDVILNEIKHIVCVEAFELQDFDFNKNINSVENITISGDTSKSIRFLGVATSNKKQEYFNIRLLKERLYKFYLDVVRGEHNLIYSPVVKNFIEPSILINLEHQVQPTNINKMLEVENDFFENKLNLPISEKELEEFKLQINNEIYNICEHQNEDLLINLIELFEDVTLEGQFTLEELTQRMLNNKDKINASYFTTQDFLTLTTYIAEAK